MHDKPVVDAVGIHRHDTSLPARPEGLLGPPIEVTERVKSHQHDSPLQKTTSRWFPFCCAGSPDNRHNITATRRSRRVRDAVVTAAAAAFSQLSVLVPTNSMILYTLSLIAVLFRFELAGDPVAADGCEFTSRAGGGSASSVEVATTVVIGTSNFLDARWTRSTRSHCETRAGNVEMMIWSKVRD